ncbi:lysophospholipid acyltransferase family protein [Thermodesulfobacteriota bacterium]
MNREKHFHPPWWERLLLLIVPPLTALIIKLACLTCRVVGVEGEERDRDAVGGHGGRAVYCTWHQRMFYHFHYFGSLGVTMMISRSRDGEWAARTAHHLGFKNVRGSTSKRGVSKGGAEAWRELIERVEEGESAGMLVDGPTGPPREVKRGAVLIASKTGAPMIPEMWGCDRAWVLNTWDRYMIPKPFSRIHVIHGEPIYVPPDIDREGVEKYMRLLEDRMNGDARRCDEIFGIERPVRMERKSE